MIVVRKHVLPIGCPKNNDVVCSRGASPDYIRLTGRNFPAEQRQP